MNINAIPNCKLSAKSSERDDRRTRMDKAVNSIFHKISKAAKINISPNVVLTD